MKKIFESSKFKTFFSWFYFRLTTLYSRLPQNYITSYKYNNSNHTLNCTICLAICLFFALTVFCLRAGNNFVDWFDGVWYLANAKQILTNSLVPRPVPYSEFTSTIELGTQYFYTDYGNYLFVLLISFVSHIRGQFSLINGMYVAGLFTILMSFVMYYFSQHVLRDRVLAMLVVVGVLIHPLVFDASARPLTETGFLFFFILSAWAMMSERPVLAGLALALGYLYREPGIFYLPFIPFLSPQRLNIKRYISILMIVGFVSMSGPLVRLLIEHFMVPNKHVENYYDYHMLMTAKKITSLNLENLMNFFGHCRNYIKQIGIIPSMVFIITAVKIRHLDKFIVRLCIVSLCVLPPVLIYHADVAAADPRHFIYAIPFLMLAFALIVRGFSFRYFFMSCFIVMLCMMTSYSNNDRKLLNLKALLADPMDYFACVQNMADAPIVALTNMPQKAVLMVSGRTYFPHLAFIALSDSIIVVHAPDFSDFLQGENNHLFDGIVLLREWLGKEWPNSSIITDNSGVKFERFSEHRVTIFRRIIMSH